MLDYWRFSIAIFSTIEEEKLLNAKRIIFKKGMKLDQYQFQYYHTLQEVGKSRLKTTILMFYSLGK